VRDDNRPENLELWTGPSLLESGLAMLSNGRAPSTTDTWALAHLQRCSRFPLSTLGVFMKLRGHGDMVKAGESSQVKEGILNISTGGRPTFGDGERGGPRTQARESQRTGKYTFSTRYVYNRCMSRVRTNIEIEDTYLETIMDRYGVRTKTEAVDLALRHLAGQPMTREEALAMRGAHAIGKVPADSKPPSS
jgi:Arc/MetJ family transcription regulator